jgi:hypothetical protein
VSGIQPGQLWGEGDGSPCNGNWVLDKTGPSVWENISGLREIYVRERSADFTVFIMNEVGLVTFSNSVYPGCKFIMANPVTSPKFQWFWGGWVSVTIREPTAGVPSIQNVQNLIGVPRDRKTFAELLITEDGKRVLRLARQRDGTRIHIKHE